MPLSELEKEFYLPETPAPEVETPEVVVPEIVVPEVVVIPEVIEPEVVIPEAVVVPEATPEPAKPTKKYIPIDDEKALYEALEKKYRPEKMKPEEKALAYIASLNPTLDENDLLFIAANEYGIGVDKVDEADLTDEQSLAIRKQDIARKQLLNKADEFFTEQAGKVELTGTNPLDDDEGYKTYQSQVQAQAEAQKQQQATLSELNTQIETNAKHISELKVPIEIDLDESKFAIEVNFKMDEAKQKEVADYAKRYSPTDAEVAKFTDSSTGKFDFKGYLADLAPRVFANQINTAALRQALATDRANFIEKELKNSTLRNNDVSQTVDTKFDLVDVWKFGG